jgi:hypothetical protein
MIAGNRVPLRAVVIAGSICLLVGFSPASKKPQQAAPHAGKKPQQAAPSAGKKPQQAAPHAGKKPQQAAPSAGEKPQQAAPSASETPQQKAPSAVETPEQKAPSAVETPEQKAPSAVETPQQAASAKPIELFYTWLEPNGVPGDKSTVLMAFRNPEKEGRLRIFWWIPQEDGGNFSEIDEALRKALYSQFSDKLAKQDSLEAVRKALRDHKTQQTILNGPLYDVSVKYVAEARPRVPIRTTDFMPTWNDLFGQSTSKLSILRVETDHLGQIKIAATQNLLLLKRATSRPNRDAQSEIVINLEAAAVELLAAMAEQEKNFPEIVDFRFLTEWDVEGNCPLLKQQLSRLLSRPASLESIPRRRDILSTILGSSTDPAGLAIIPVDFYSHWTLSNTSLKEVNFTEIAFQERASGPVTKLLKNASISGCGQGKLSVFFSDGKNHKELARERDFKVDPERIKPGSWRLVITRRNSKPWIAGSRASVVNGEIQVELERFGARHLFSKVVSLGVSVLRMVTPWLWRAGLAFGVLLGLVWLGRRTWHRWRKQPSEPTPVEPSASAVDTLPPVDAAKSGAEVPIETGNREPYESTGETGKPQAPASNTAAEPLQQSVVLHQQLESLREEREKIKRELREKEDRYVSAAGESTRLRKELTDLKERVTAQKEELKAKTEQTKDDSPGRSRSSPPHWRSRKARTPSCRRPKRNSLRRPTLGRPLCRESVATLRTLRSAGIAKPNG